MYNLMIINYASVIIKKPPRMFQWDAVYTSPDFGGQNVLKTFEMAIRHNMQMT